MSDKDRIQLTAQEKAAIRYLKRLAARWPKSLWLFSGSGSLNVMKCGEDGERVYTGSDPGRHWQVRHDEAGEQGGVNREYVVAVIDIPNDGGDW